MTTTTQPASKAKRAANSFVAKIKADAKLISAAGGVVLGSVLPLAHIHLPAADLNWARLGLGVAGVVGALVIPIKGDSQSQVVADVSKDAGDLIKEVETDAPAVVANVAKDVAAAAPKVAAEAQTVTTDAAATVTAAADTTK